MKIPQCHKCNRPFITFGKFMGRLWVCGHCLEVMRAKPRQPPIYDEAYLKFVSWLDEHG